MDYQNFSLNDFITDEYFQDWVLRPNDESNFFWNNWINENQDRKSIVEQARQVLLHIKFKEDFPPEQQVKDALAQNLDNIAAIEERHRHSKVIRLHNYRKLTRIAAIFIGALLLISSLFYYRWKTETVTVATNYGELKTVSLPDGSQITLNAKSSITYLKHWPESSDREVRLRGEALFKVNHLNKNAAHIQKGERFIVTTNDLKVEVLGTTFDVKNRRGETNVILISGRVRIDFTGKNHKSIALLPGEMIDYKASDGQFEKTVTNPVAQTSWVDKKLILENASVGKIIEYIEDNYGYKVILKDTSIANKKMEGTLLLDNLRDVLFVLSTSLDIKIQKEDSTLIFSKN